tara:strand:+ start:14119 stop:16581 length:2463 start_codon:yes stop_codon:yes gene_type:complete
MSFKKCIDDGVAEGTIPQDKADEIKALFDELEKEYQTKMGAGSAQSKAAGDALEATKIKNAQKRRTKLKQAAVWNNLSKILDESENINATAKDIMSVDTARKFSNVQGRIQNVENRATSYMDEILANTRRDVLGRVRNKATLENIVKEMLGDATDDVAAKEMAEALSKTFEMLRTRRNVAGANTGKIDKYFPQTHHTLKVRKAGYNNWRNKITPLLDRTRMIDNETNLPFTDDGLEKALVSVYETISTQGYNKLAPKGTPRQSSLVNKSMEHRFLHFKNAESFLSYHNEFGDGQLFDVMMGHIKSMSRDIGLMEVLGPNPNSTLNFIKQTIEKDAALRSSNAPDTKLLDKAKQTGKEIDELYGYITGSNNQPINAVWGQAFAGTRQIIQSSFLGAASLAAITDVNFSRMARGFTGLPQTNTLSKYLKTLSPLGAEEKGKLALRLGLIAEGWTSLASAQMRYTGDISGPEFTRRISDFVMRASLLSPMTQAGRWAFGMEFLGTLADNAAKSFDQLNPDLQKTLSGYGFNSGRWDLIRKTKPYEHEGAKFLRAEDIEDNLDIPTALRQDLATRMMEMVETETNFAVPSSSLRGSTTLRFGTRGGTIPGEIINSFAMFKNFGVTLFNTHIMRGVNLPTSGAKLTYFTDFLITTTLMGALAMQLKEMVKGRDPRSMNTPEFWGAAILQGGGLGIYGDFLFSDLNRFDRGLGKTVAGPVVGLGEDLINLTFGNMAELAQGKDTNIASESVKFVNQYLPGQSIWYARTILERQLFNRLQQMADPKFEQKQRRYQRKLKRDTGQGFWWKPGEALPERSPDFENIVAN